MVPKLFLYSCNYLCIIIHYYYMLHGKRRLRQTSDNGSKLRNNTYILTSIYTYSCCGWCMNVIRLEISLLFSIRISLLIINWKMKLYVLQRLINNFEFMTFSGTGTYYTPKYYYTRLQSQIHTRFNVNHTIFYRE